MRTPRGYLLMEALIAGALVAVALTTTITLIGTSRIETTMAARRAQASALAMAKAEELLAKDAGETQALVAVGTKHPGFQWSWSVGDAAAVRGQSTPPIGGGKLDLISVTVRFPTSKGPENLTYERLRRNP